MDKLTGDELNMKEAIISRKMRAGDATTDEIKEYNMISRRMGAVNVSLDRQRMNVAGVNGFTTVQKKARRRRRRKNLNKK